MPTLPNARHEQFCQALASGKTADEAYALAGYKPNRANASVLKSKQNISTRVAELLNGGAERAQVTVESLINEAEEARRAAMELGQISAAVAAIKEKGVLSGKRIERHEIDEAGAFDSMSDEALAAALVAKMAQLGLAPDEETKH